MKPPLTFLLSLTLDVLKMEIKNRETFQGWKNRWEFYGMVWKWSEKAEGYFKNGKEDGVFTVWDIDGKFKNKILCKDGMQQ